MKNTPSLHYIFENPNTPATFEEVLKKILLEKLLTEFTYSSPDESLSHLAPKEEPT